MLCLQRLVQSMDNTGVDVIVYPTWSFPPRLLGASSLPDGNNSPGKLALIHAVQCELVLLTQYCCSGLYRAGTWLCSSAIQLN